MPLEFGVDESEPPGEAADAVDAPVRFFGTVISEDPWNADLPDFPDKLFKGDGAFFSA